MQLLKHEKPSWGWSFNTLKPGCVISVCVFKMSSGNIIRPCSYIYNNAQKAFVKKIDKMGGQWRVFTDLGEFITDACDTIDYIVDTRTESVDEFNQKLKKP